MSKFKVGDHVMHRTQGPGIVVCTPRRGVLISVQAGMGNPRGLYQDLCKNLDANKRYWHADEEFLTKINTFKGNV